MVSKKWLLGAPFLFAGAAYIGHLIYQNKALVAQLLEWAEEQIKTAGTYNVAGTELPLAPLYILMTYTVACILVLPLFGIHTLCGYIYGTFWGAFIVSFSQMIAASVCFAGCRFLLRDRAANFMKGRWGARYEAMDKALSAGGFKIVVLLRLSPVIPFCFTNYVSACTSIDLFKFAPATWLGIAPGTTFYCALGAMGRVMKDQDDAKASMSHYKMALVVIGLIGTGFLLKYIADIATKALADIGIGNESTVKKDK